MLTRFATALHATPAWGALLQARGWADAFLAGEAFDAFLGMMQGRNVGKMVVRTAVAD